MSGNSVQISYATSPKSISSILISGNCLFAALLACPMIPGLSRCFANTYLCAGLILILVFLNYSLYKASESLTSGGSPKSEKGQDWKSRAKVLAWAALIPAVILVGVGPIASPSAYAVDKFNRIFGMGVINDYSVSRKVHYFYFALIIYGLLVFNFYQTLWLSLLRNRSSKIRRLGEFADTLLFVGYSFLLVCIYRQFSSQYSYDLTLYLLKSILVFMVPAFCLWETGKLKVQDVRVMLSLALFSLVLSVNIVLYFDTRNFARFSDILDVVLLVSLIFFVATRKFSFFSDRAVYSKVTVLSLLGALSLVFFSLAFESLNIHALKTGRFINIETIFRMAFYTVLWLSIGWICCVRKKVNKKTAGAALFAFVLGLSLIQAQPSLIIGSGLDIFESANYAVPISDFFNFGKLPWFENFPGHGLSGVISSIAYGAITSDYKGAVFAPWSGWLFMALSVLVVYCFVKSISNGFVAVSVAILLPYIVRYTSSYGIGLVVILPFMLYVRTLRNKYLVWTVLLAIFVLAYRLDIGFAFLAAILCSSFCVEVFYGRKIISRTLLYFAIAGAAVFALFLATCLVKDINPLFRIQQYLSVAASNDNWGYNNLGDTEKTSYAFFYFVIPALSIICLIAAIVWRKKFSVMPFAVLMCLLFAYYANIPRFLVRHSLVEYGIFTLSLWIWTMLFALPFLISRIFSSRSLFVLIQTSFSLLVYVFFQGTTVHADPTLQKAVSRSEIVSAEVNPLTRKNDVSLVFSRGSRVFYDETRSEGLIYSNEIKDFADLLLSPDETFLDFTNQGAAYAWSVRNDPSYVVQSPSMLSGEKSQRLFITELESKLDKVPLAIMPTEKSWYLTLFVDGINNNIRHYLVAEWIYAHYRPFFKFNDHSSVWVLKSRFDEFYDRLSNNIQQNVTEFPFSLSDSPTLSCHNCHIRMTDEGLEIKPIGTDPFVSDFDRLIGVRDLKSFTKLALYLAEHNAGDYQVFVANDKVSEFSEANSSHALSLHPDMKIFDLRKFYRSAGQIERLRLDVPENGTTVIKAASISSSNLQLIDWGYDNFVSLPAGAVPGAEYISIAHDYNVEFLPFIWGQLDSKNAASNADLTEVYSNGETYTWDYSGKESRPAYLRLDLSVNQELLKNANSSSITLGDMKDGKYTALDRFRFKLKEGQNAYLFRISSDYYWSCGKLNTLYIDASLRKYIKSVRILEGD